MQHDNNHFYLFDIATRKKTAADRGFIPLAEITSWLQPLAQLQAQLVLQEHLS
jgi:hypothetical protein